MKPLTDNWKQKERCTECGAVFKNEYECSYCGTVYKKRPDPEPKFKTIVEKLPMTPADIIFLLMFFPFSLFIMKPKTKTTTVCINEEELKKSSVKVQDPYPHTEKSEDPKKTNPGCAVLIIFMILIYFIYKCCVK